MRYAIYYTPAERDPLTVLATSWLGRSAFTGESTPPRAIGRLPAAEVAYHTAAARRYGFHGTILAPFTLADGETEHGLRAALDAYFPLLASSCPDFAPGANNDLADFEAATR